MKKVLQINNHCQSKLDSNRRIIIQFRNIMTTSINKIGEERNLQKKVRHVEFTLLFWSTIISAQLFGIFTFSFTVKAN